MTTQYANASYQEVIDLHTESDKVSVVGIHTPNSDTPYLMLRGFWTQFKKFKYNGCSISLVPAAQLPADPLQVSYEAGEPTIDPRDMLNPILFHGCHGDDMGAILNSLYNADNASSFIDMMQSDSADLNVFPQSVMSGLGDTEVYEALYYKAMTDKTWLKAHPQRGFRKSGLHPMVYSLASTVQYGLTNNSTLIYPEASKTDSLDGSKSIGIHGTLGYNNGNNDNVFGAGSYGRPTADVSNNNFVLTPAHANNGFLTPRLQKLGWMDTRQIVGVDPLRSVDTITSSVAGGTAPGLANLYQQANAKVNPVLVPKIFMGMIMLPPAYKTEQYFRLVINHSFSFAKFRGASMDYTNNGIVRKAPSVFDFNDSEASKKDDEAHKRGEPDEPKDE